MDLEKARYALQQENGGLKARVSDLRRQLDQAAKDRDQWVVQRGQMEGALQSPLAQVTTEVEVEDIRFVRDDVAIVSCVKHVHDEREDATTSLPAAGALTYVMAKQPEGWRIALAQTTPIRV